MQTIKSNIINQNEIKKSKFITLLYKVDSINEINNLINDAKNNYKDATHYCYAYKLDNVQKFNDDNEPSGTAGLPILEVLNKREINHVLCIVIRYFGGIKLGAGGLIRAYSNATREALDKCQTIKLVEGYLLKIIAPYDIQKQNDYLFKDKIVKKEFNEYITYYIELPKKDLNTLTNIDYQIIDNIWITK